MTTKRKWIISCVVLTLLVGIGVRHIVQTNARNKYRENLYIDKIYMLFFPEEYIPSNEITVDFLKEHPLPLEMDGPYGLYIKAATYEFYTGQSVDYLAMQELLSERKYAEICAEYKPFMDWMSVNKGKPMDFWVSICTVANTHPEFIEWNNGQELDSYSNYEAYAKAWELYEDEVRAYLKR